MNNKIHDRMSELAQPIEQQILMCDSREDWDLNKLIEKIYDKPRIG